MNITKQTDGNKIILFLDGKLDTVTAPQLDAALKTAFEESDTVEINLENLAYVSSAGLRLLLAFHKTMIQQGGRMVIRHVNDIVGDVLEVTGFIDFLNVE